MMDQTNGREKPKKKGWKIALFVVLGILLALVIAAVLMAAILFKSLKSVPEKDTASQPVETVEQTGSESTAGESTDKEGNKESGKDVTSQAVQPPETADGQVDAAVVREAMVSEEVLDAIDDETEDIIQKAIQDNLASMPDTDGVFSVLLIGNDTRSVGLQERTDCIFLASVNQNTNQLVLTAFPQNLYVYIPDWDSTNLLHVVNAMGGPALTAETIEQSFGVKIDAYASISFESFEQAVDSFGGVDMTLSSADLSQITSGGTAPAEVEPGVYRLNGEQALAYCRGQGGGDADHTNRQFAVIRKLWEQSKNASFAKRYNVLQQTLKNITTTVTGNQCLNLLLDMGDLHKYEAVSASLPAEGLFEQKTTPEATVLVADMKGNTDYIRGLIYG